MANDNRSRRVTILDVARVAGVSPQTVSRVLNGKGEVSPQTRDLVQSAIEHLGYRPNHIARGLVTRRTHTIGLLVPDIANPFFPEIHRGVEAEVEEAGYRIFLVNTDEQPEREVRMLQALAEHRVDGVILCSSRLPDADLVRVVRDFPAVVLINRPSPLATVDSVAVADEEAMAALGRWLVSAGYHKVAFLAGPPTSRSGQARRQGLLRVLEASTAALSPTVVWCAPTIEGGQEAATALLRSHSSFDVLVCYNDLVALGALHACRAAGLAIPVDLAVTGFDDIPLAALASPPLTTVRVPKRTLGQLAAHLLIERLNGRQEAVSIRIVPELVIRESAPGRKGE